LELFWQDIRRMTEADARLWFSETDGPRQQQLLRLRHPADRLRSLAGDHLARQAVAAQSGLTPGEVVLARTAQGKPYAVGLPVFFSISHSGSLVLCAADASPVGADIQLVGPVSARLIGRVCTQRELAWVTGGTVLPPQVADRSVLERFFTVWTEKEAWCKYTGEGLQGFFGTDTFALPENLSMLHFRHEDYAVALCRGR